MHALRGRHTDAIEFSPEEAMKQLKDLDGRIRNQHKHTERPFPCYKTQILKKQVATQTEKDYENPSS